MNPVLLALLILVTFAVLSLFFVIFASTSASAQWQFTRIKKGDMIFVVKGEDLKMIIPNVDGHKISREKDQDGRRWLIKVDVRRTNKEQKKEMRDAFDFKLMPGTKWFQWIIWDNLGIRFVSWIYPIIKVHKIHISMNRLREDKKKEDEENISSPSVAKKGEEEDVPLRNRIESDEGDVDSLRFIIPRPMVVEGVELAGDNSRIDLLALSIFKVVIPSLPVFYHKGKFMPLLDAAVSAGIVDFFAHPVKIKGDDGAYEEVLVKYADWLQMPKGPGSEIEKHLCGLNASAKYYDQLKQAVGNNPEKEKLLNHLHSLIGGRPSNDELPSGGLISTYGLFLESVRIVGWRADKSTRDLANAYQAEETETLKARGVRAEARGAGDAISVKGAAEAKRFHKLFRALIAEGASPDEALRTLRAFLQAGELKNIPNLQTLVLGETAPPAIMVNKS